MDNLKNQIENIKDLLLIMDEICQIDNDIKIKYNIQYEYMTFLNNLINESNDYFYSTVRNATQNDNP